MASAPVHSASKSLSLAVAQGVVREGVAHPSPAAAAQRVEGGARELQQLQPRYGLEHLARRLVDIEAPAELARIVIDGLQRHFFLRHQRAILEQAGQLLADLEYLDIGIEQPLVLLLEHPGRVGIGGDDGLHAQRVEGLDVRGGEVLEEVAVTQHEHEGAVAYLVRPQGAHVQAGLQEHLGRGAHGVAQGGIARVGVAGVEEDVGFLLG